MVLKCFLIIYFKHRAVDKELVTATVAVLLMVLWVALNQNQPWPKLEAYFEIISKLKLTFHAITRF
jgi:hypothetical protein